MHHHKHSRRSKHRHAKYCHRCNSGHLREELGAVWQKAVKARHFPTNGDEKRYRCRGFAGSFTKTLLHDKRTGELRDSKDYSEMASALVHGDQNQLAAVPLAPRHESSLVGPWTSLARVLLGSEACTTVLEPPPSLRSRALAAEVIEVYAMLVARDIPFADYSEENLSAELRALNNPCVLAALPEHPCNVPFTAQTLFRGPLVGDALGPYLSQLLCQPYTSGAKENDQRYLLPPTRSAAQQLGVRVEWGVDAHETILQQNTYVSQLPPDNAPRESRYVSSGRGLAEIVHRDPLYEFYYNASLVLLGAGVGVNRGLPHEPNQQPFITVGGSADIFSAVADVAHYAMQVAWFWKWQVHRRLRPEVVGLWVDNVRQGRVSNEEYELSSLLLDSSILRKVRKVNASWTGERAYTLNTCYPEGSPNHPAYPAGHAITAGACTTMLKMLFDTQGKPWTDVAIPLQATSSGDALVPYTGSDAAQLTIDGELNKLASNIALGRDWAGVHYRTDGIRGILLGEQVAINYMKDRLASYYERQTPRDTEPYVVFDSFKGERIVVRPTVH